MATETVLSHHSEEVGKEVQSEVKKIEAEDVCPPSKESVENTQPEESAKIEESPAIEDVGDDEKPKAASAEPTEEKAEDKPVELPPAEDKDKTEVVAPLAEVEDARIVDEGIQEVPPETVPPPVAASISEPTIEKAECKNEEKSEEAEPAGKQEEPNVESFKEKAEECKKEKSEEAEAEPAAKQEQPNVESIKEKAEEFKEEEKSKEAGAEPAAKQEEPNVESNKEKAEECKKEEKSEEAEPAGIQEETNVEPIKEKPEETAKVVDVAAVKEQESPAKVVEAVEAKDVAVFEAGNKPEEQKPHEQIEEENPEAKSLENTKLKEKEETCPVEGSDHGKAEDPVNQVEEKHVESNPTDAGNEVTEAAKESVEAAGLSDKKAVEPGKIEAPEEKSVVAEELVQCEEKPTDIAERELEKTDAGEKIEENEQTAEAKLEEVKKADEENVQAAEAKVEEKIEETEGKEEEKQVCEPAKTDTDSEASQEGVPVKTQKQSFVKIVKQSLVKAKKAIIGKSNNSKTPASESKDDGNK